MPKIYLSSTLLAGGGYRLLPEGVGDFAPGSLGGLLGSWTAGADFNADGQVDIVVGAAGSDDKDIDAGRVYVTLAPGSATLGDTLTEVIIDGVLAGDQAGAAVATITSMNADSVPDILIGAPGLNLSGADAGGAYVVWGSAVADGIDLGDLQASGGPGFVIKGQAAGDHAGEALAAIGSLNGDARADIVIGASGNDACGADAGAAYVVWGKSSTGPVALANVALGTGGYRITGENAGDGVGKTVAAMGDLNGDGKQEVLLGAAGNDAGGNNAGAVYVAWGQATGTEVNLDNVAAGTGGFKVSGSANQGLGSAVAAVGDLNNDGLVDVLAGTRLGDVAYVIFGKNNGSSLSTAQLAAGIGGFAITAETGRSLAGMTVAGGIDLNHDGVADFVIGAPHDNEGGTDAGAVYVIWGGGSGTVDLNLIAQGIGGTKIVGDAGSLTGASVQIIADANGDGSPDLLIGSSGAGGAQVSVLYAPAEWLPGPEVYGTGGADNIVPGYGFPHTVGDAADNIFAYGGNDTISAAGGDDTIDGGDGNDQIDAGDGNDEVLASAGIDTVHGGAGDDVISLSDAGGTVWGDSGNDALTGGAAADQIDAGDGMNVLQGGGGNDALSSGIGNDVLDGGSGADTMTGGAGDDIYYVDDIGDVVIDSAGNDKVVVSADLIAAGWTSASAIETLSVQGSLSVKLTGDIGNNELIAGAGDDTLDGGEGDDTEIGGEGDDTLISSAGHDTLVGGTGDDTYHVSGGAAHIEDFQGDDTIDASESESDDVIDLEDGHTSTVEGQVIDLGNGGSTSQTLDVQFLQDLSGSFGDDIAVVQTLVPQIVSALQAVQANSQFGVSSFVDKGVAPFGAAGEWVYQQELGLTSNATLLSNTYNGLTIRYGADEPEAQIESLMQLGLHQAEAGFRDGSARFVILFTDAPFHQAGDGAAAGITIANNGDAVMDGGGIGEDYPDFSQVQAALQAANLIPIFAVANGYESVYQGLVASLGRGSVVSLTADSSNVVAAIQAGLIDATTTLIENARGGAGNDRITGNQVANRLDGGAGNDTISGLAGDDSLTGGLGNDQLTGGDGSDTAVYAGAQSQFRVAFDAVTGNAVVTDTATGQTDTVSEVEFLSFGGVSLATASAATGAWLVGTAGNDALTGTTGHDLLDGGLGVDSLAGGKGDDVYVVDAVGEVVTELSGGGLDEVRASVTLTLAAYVENLVLTGVAALNGTGNNAANRITGNSAANTLLGSGGNDSLIGGDGADKLNGGTGIDWLDGGNGNDTYTVDSAADQVFESTGAAGGTDLVNATVSFSLSAFIENLTLTGALMSDATGSELANKLTGNSAANHLNGGAGVDTLIGNAGADVLEGGLGNDKLTGGADADRFVMLAGGGKDTVTDFAIGIDHIDLTAFGLADLSTVTFKDLGANTQLTLATGESLVLNGIADFHVLSASDFFL